MGCGVLNRGSLDPLCLGIRSDVNRPPPCLTEGATNRLSVHPLDARATLPLAAGRILLTVASRKPLVVPAGGFCYSHACGRSLPIPCGQPSEPSAGSSDGRPRASATLTPRLGHVGQIHGQPSAHRPVDRQLRAGGFLPAALLYLCHVVPRTAREPHYPPQKDAHRRERQRLARCI
jgi:hypothetical protein